MDEKELLLKIALHNSQVRCILRDLDVAAFYKKLLQSMNALTSEVQEVTGIIEKED